MKKIKSQDLTAFSNTKRTASSEAESLRGPTGRNQDRTLRRTVAAQSAAKVKDPEMQHAKNSAVGRNNASDDASAAPARHTITQGTHSKHTRAGGIK